MYAGMVRAVAAAAVLILGLDLAAAAAWGTAGPAHYAWETSNALVWVAVGVAASWIRPDSRIGMVMAMVGLLLAANATATFGFVAGTAPAVAQTVAYALVALQPTLVGHAILGYPEGRLTGRASRVLVAVSYGFAAADLTRVLLATATPGPDGGCAQRCAHNPWQFVHGQAADRLAAAAQAGWLLLGVAFALVLVCRLRRSSTRERRVQAVPLLAAFGTAVVFVLLGIPGTTSTAGDHIDVRTKLLQAVSVLAVPLAFLVGLLRERLAHAQVADLIRALERAPLEELGVRVARALGDPTAQVVFPRAGGHVDPAGNPTSLPDANSARRVTPLGDGDAPLALLLHDRHLEREPSLLAAAGAATRLTVENARLHAEVRAQLAEVRASRARLVSAGDAERRRLERDLHDGAQQRLLSLGVLLRLLSKRLKDADNDAGTATDMLQEALTELAAAVDELRQLARGIHPAVLTDLGLRAAVRQLADRSPVPVTLDVSPGPRLPADIEATAYFVICEGLTNVARHAPGATVHLTVTTRTAAIRVTVRDDGPGGADPRTGSGLRGLADRVATVDGALTIHSPAGAGTTLIADLPLGWR